MYKKRLLDNSGDDNNLPNKKSAIETPNASEQNQLSALEQLPKDILRHIFGFFNKRELIEKGAILNKNFYNLCTDPHLVNSAKWPPLDYTKFSKKVVNEIQGEGAIRLLSNGEFITVYWNTIRRGNSDKPNERATLDQNPCHVLELSPESIAVITSSASIYTIDLKSFKVDLKFKWDEACAHARFLNNGKIALTLLFINKIRIVDINKQNFFDIDCELSPNKLFSLLDGNFACTFGNHSICIFDSNNGKKIDEIILPRHQNIWYVQQLKDERIIWLDIYSREFFIWDKKSKDLSKFSPIDILIKCIEALPDDKIITGDTQGRVIMWDFQTMEYNFIVKENDIVEAMKILDNGKILIVTNNYERSAGNITTLSFKTLLNDGSKIDSNNNNQLY